MGLHRLRDAALPGAGAVRTSAGARAATPDDPARAVDTFVAAALRAERAGSSGGELRGGTGCRFPQFFAPADIPATTPGAATSPAAPAGGPGARRCPV